MKTLTNCQATVTGSKVVITADIVDVEFDLPVQQVTVGYVSEKNRNWPRHIQLSHEAVFVKAYGVGRSAGFAFMQDDLVMLAAKVEPATSYPPKFNKKVENDLTVDISTELNPSFQWQVSDKIDKNQVWTDIPGATNGNLKRDGLEGKFVRCIASSESGSMISNPVKV